MHQCVNFVINKIAFEATQKAVGWLKKIIFSNKFFTYPFKIFFLLSSWFFEFRNFSFNEQLFFIRANFTTIRYPFCLAECDWFLLTELNHFLNEPVFYRARVGTGVCRWERGVSLVLRSVPWTSTRSNGASPCRRVVERDAKGEINFRYRRQPAAPR